YLSAYLKAHYAPEFYASLLNNQPMGFYSSATLIKDGQRHGVKFRPVCVMRSDWDCTIEEWRDALYESPTFSTSAPELPLRSVAQPSAAAGWGGVSPQDPHRARRSVNSQAGTPALHQVQGQGLKVRSTVSTRP